MKRTIRLIAVAATAATIPAMLAAAAPAGTPLQIETRLAVEQHVRAADGTTATRLAPATRVVPGNAVRVTVSYRNVGTAPLAGVAITNAVPASTSYRGVAPGTPEPEVTIDGARFAPLAVLRVGARLATPSDVTAVRWRLQAPLTAGASGQFAFTAVVK